MPQRQTWTIYCAQQRVPNRAISGFEVSAPSLLPLVAEAPGRREPRILDCGCGTGANVELLSRYGRAFGFDLSSTGLRLGREAGRTRLARASVTAAPFPSAIIRPRDVVRRALFARRSPTNRRPWRRCSGWFAPGGFALINVAAMDMLRGDHSVLSHERRRYSRESLRALLVAAGFTIVRLTYTNAALFLPLAALRAVQRMRGLAVEVSLSERFRCRRLR